MFDCAFKMMNGKENWLIISVGDHQTFDNEDQFRLDVVDGVLYLDALITSDSCNQYVFEVHEATDYEPRKKSYAIS